MTKKLTKEQKLSQALRGKARGPIAKYAATVGKKLREGKSNVELEVEARDTRSANKLSPSTCGFAKACKRQVPGVQSVHFFRGVAWLEFADRLERYILPPAVRQQITTFDVSGVIAPGSYHLRAPAASEGLAAQRKSHRNLREARRTGKRDGSRRPRSIMTGVRTVADPAHSA